MRGLLCLALCSLLVSGGIAHDVEDDFDDEAEVEEEAEEMDTVTVEKVTIDNLFLKKFSEQLNFTKNRLNHLIKSGDNRRSLPHPIGQRGFLFYGRAG